PGRFRLRRAGDSQTSDPAFRTPQSTSSQIRLTSAVTPSGRAVGWVLYDRECRLCVGAVHRFERILQRHRFEVVALQTDWARQRLGLPAGSRPVEMALLTSDGRVRGGADALLEKIGRAHVRTPVTIRSRMPSSA